MTKPSPEIEALAQERLKREEARIAGNRRSNVSLGEAWREFWRHPSPYIITGTLLAATAARVIAGGGAWWELLIPLVLVLTFPLTEWVVHVVILHWRPRQVGRVTLDSLLARKHREHHADPRDLPLVFIPWQVQFWLVPLLVGVSLLVMPTVSSALTTMVSIAAIGFGYEWTHYLVHSDYRPRSRWYRALWRNHRLHHYKNEHYWFTLTSAGTADRLLGTYPDPSTVATSPTVKQLHATEA